MSKRIDTDSVLGPIEKGCVDGQSSHVKDLFSSLKTTVSSPIRAVGGAGGPRGKKKGKKGKTPQLTSDVEDSASKAKANPNKNWGPFESVRGIMEPISDLLGPFAANLIYGLVIGFMGFALARFFSPNRATPFRDLGMAHHDRAISYDAMWRREESELLEWLEERVGLNRLHGDMPTNPIRAMEPRALKDKLSEAKLKEQEMEAAIRVTEEKLKVLKDTLGKSEQ
jgi:hypothetical protein